MDAEVVVVGAGLAGLRAAVSLERSGYDVVVLEASDAVGGRVRTDLIDGFRVDRGFQLLNPAYAELRRCADVSALRIQQVGRGVAVRNSGGLHQVADPSRFPLRGLRQLRGPYLTPRQARTLGAWLAAGFAPPSKQEPDRSLGRSLDEAGLRGPLRTEILEPFLAGVLADASGDSSAEFARRMLHWMALATPGLPAQGMAALPAQLADRLQRPIEFGVQVQQVTGGDRRAAVRTAAGHWRANAVIVATDAAAAAQLLGLEARPTRGLATWWFATETAPSPLPVLHLDADRAGPVVNTAVVSNAAPSYAPIGRHLVQASALLAGGTPTEDEVRRHAGAIYGVDASGWEVIAQHAIPHALPVMRPGSGPADVALGEGLFVAGDHRQEASIQGALVSGRRAANSVRRRAAVAPRRPRRG